MADDQVQNTQEQQEVVQAVPVVVQPSVSDEQSSAALFAKASDYTLTLRVLRVLKQFIQSGKQLGSTDDAVADQLLQDYPTGYSHGEVKQALNNIRKVDGKGRSLQNAAMAVDDEKIAGEYEKFKQAEQAKMDAINEDLEPAKDETKLAGRELRLNRAGLWGARLGRVGLVAGTAAIGFGYVGGCLTLAGGLAALTAVSSMGLLTVAAIGGVLLYKVGKALVPKLFKGLGNLIDKFKAKINGNEFGSVAEYKKRKRHQRELQKEYNKHKNNLREDAIFNAEQLSNQMPVAANAQQNVAAVANAAQNGAAQAAVIEPVNAAGNQNAMQLDAMPRHSTEADYRKIARENSDPERGPYRDRNIYTVPTEIVSTNSPYQDNQQSGDYIFVQPQAPISSSATVDVGSDYKFEDRFEKLKGLPRFATTNTTLSSANSTDAPKAVHTGGIQYTYPVAKSNIEVYNASPASAETREFTLKNADVETFVRMALRMDLQGAPDIHEIARNVGKLDINQKRLVDLTDKELKLTDAQAREAAKGILANFAGVTNAQEQDRIIGASNRFVTAVKREMEDFRAVVQKIQKANNQQRIAKGGSRYAERDYIQDVVDGKITLDGKDVKTIINEYFTANHIGNNINLNIPGSGGQRDYTRHELLSVVRQDRNGNIQKPLEPRAIEKFGATAGLTQFAGHILSDQPEYVEYLSEEEYQQLREVFADAPQIQTKQELEEYLEQNKVRTALEARVKAGEKLSDRDQSTLDFLRKLSRLNVERNNHQDITVEYDPNATSAYNVVDIPKENSKSQAQQSAKLAAIQNFIDANSELGVSDYLRQKLQEKKDLSTEEQTALDILQNKDLGLLTGDEYAEHLKRLEDLQKSLRAKKVLTDEETLVLIALNEDLKEESSALEQQEHVVATAEPVSAEELKEAAEQLAAEGKADMTVEYDPNATSAYNVIDNSKKEEQTESKAEPIVEKKKEAAKAESDKAQEKIEVTEEDIDTFLEAISHADSDWQQLDITNKAHDEVLFKILNSVPGSPENEQTSIRFRLEALERYTNGNVALKKVTSDSEKTINNFIEVVKKTQEDSKSESKKQSIRDRVRKFLQTKGNGLAVLKQTEGEKLSAEKDYFKELFSDKGKLDAGRLRILINRINSVQQQIKELDNTSELN